MEDPSCSENYCFITPLYYSKLSIKFLIPSFIINVCVWCEYLNEMECTLLFQWCKINVTLAWIFWGQVSCEDLETLALEHTHTRTHMDTRTWTYTHGHTHTHAHTHLFPFLLALTHSNRVFPVSPWIYNHPAWQSLVSVIIAVTLTPHRCVHSFVRILRKQTWTKTVFFFFPTFLENLPQL